MKFAAVKIATPFLAEAMPLIAQSGVEVIGSCAYVHDFAPAVMLLVRGEALPDGCDVTLRRRHYGSRVDHWIRAVLIVARTEAIDATPTFLRFELLNESVRAPPYP